MGCAPSRIRSAGLSDCVRLKSSSFADPEGELVSCADSGGRLGTVLELEFLLHKVLSHVVDDGIHECRLVCRFWRKVCSSLPVRIRRIRPAEASLVLQKFPMTVSLILGRPVSDDDLPTSYAIPLLSQLGNLRHLHLALHPRRAIPAIMRPCLESMDRLRHLSLGIESDAAYHSAIEAIRRLSQIESLTLAVFVKVQVDPSPVTEISGLRFLSAPLRVLVDRSGGLLFPSLTQLTALECLGNTASDVRLLVEQKVRRIPCASFPILSCVI